MRDLKDRIIIGCDQLGGQDWGNLRFEDVVEAIQFSLDSGFRRFDTADVYGLGDSETRLGTLINRYREDIEVNTKVGVSWKYESGKSGRQVTARNTDAEYLKRAIMQSKGGLGRLLRTTYMYTGLLRIQIGTSRAMFRDLKDSAVVNRYG